MSKTRPIQIRLLRIIGKLLLGILVLVILLLASLRLPVVQNFLASRAQQFLRNKTQTEISIGKISLDYAGNILLRELMIPDRYRDTVLHLGELSLGIQYLPLLKKEIRVSTITLRDVTADVHPDGDGQMNYQYLIDAMSGPVDTSTVSDHPDESKSWSFGLTGTHLVLDQVEGRYLMVDSSLYLGAKIGELSLHVRDADLSTGEIDLSHLLVEHTLFVLNAKEGETEASVHASPPTRYVVKADGIDLRDVGYAMSMADLALNTHIGSLNLQNPEMQLLGDTMRIRVPALNLDQSTYRMDLADAPPAQGFDYGHLDLRDITFYAKDLTYDNQDVHTRITKLQASDVSGATLRHFQGLVHYHPDSISVREVILETPDSKIDLPSGRIALPPSEHASFEEMTLDIVVDSAIIKLGDVAYYMPALYAQPNWNSLQHETWRLGGNFRGTLGDLMIDRLQLRSGSNSADLSGNMQHLTDPERLAANLTIHRLHLNASMIRQWLPAGTLPEGALPGAVSLSGQINGSAQKLNFNLSSGLTRDGVSSAGVHAQGTLWHILDPDHLSYLAHIDSLWALRSEIEAWLPDSLPQSLFLPDAVMLSGDLQGTPDSAFIDMRIHAVRGEQSETYMAFSGQVSNFSDLSHLAYAIDLKEMHVTGQEILAWIPDSLLPEYLAIPAITDSRGSFSGDLANGDGTIWLNTSAGEINASLHLADSAYAITLTLEDFVVQEIFRDSVAFDTIIGWPAPPMYFHTEIQGHGFNPDSNLNASVSANLRFLGDSLHWSRGLQVEGAVDRRSFSGTLIMHEEALDFDLAVLVSFNPQEDTASVSGQINEADLYAMQLLSFPFNLKTRLNMQSKGWSPDSLAFDFASSDLYLLFDTLYQHSDTMDIHFRRFTGQHVFALNIASDFMELSTFDQVNHPKEFRAGIDRLVDALDVEISKLQLNSDTTRNVFVDLNITRPEFFTSGLVPGLTELEPIHVIGAIDMLDSSFAVSSEIPHVKYGAFAFDSTLLRAVRWDEVFLAGLKIRSAHLFDDIHVRDLEFAAVDRGQDTTRFFLYQKDSLLAPESSQQVRFLIAISSTEEAGRRTIRVARPPILNFDTTWQIHPENAIILSKGNIEVDNFVLSKEHQRLSIHEVDDQTMQLKLEDIDLAVISDAIKWKQNYVHGELNGGVSIRNPYDDLSFTGEIEFSEFGVMGAELGQLNLQTEMDHKGNMDAVLTLSGNNTAEIKGSYHPADGAIAATIKTDLSRLQTFVHFMPETIDSAHGTLRTDLTLSGTTSKPTLTGDLSVENLYVKPSVIGSPLLIPATTLHLTPTRIAPDGPIVLRDTLGHEAKLTLEINPSDFPKLGFSGNLQAKNFLVLRIPDDDGELYSGTVFADLSIDILGSTSDVIRIKGDLTPREGSHITYLYDTGGELQKIETGGGIVEFVNFGAQDAFGMTQQQGEATAGGDYDIILTTHINHDLALHVIMDRINGDHLEGKGAGELALHLSQHRDIEATGQLDVSGSKYLYTYEGLIRREFELNDGSTISFTGPIDNPTLDLSANYDIRTSPELLIKTYGESDADPNRLSRRQEFQVEIHVDGALEDATIGADILYPHGGGQTIPDLVDPALSKLRSNPSEMNTQAFSLIIFNSFSIGGSSAQSIVDVKQEVGDVVSGQLNALAARYINFVELDFGIETLSEGSFDFTDTDFRVGVKKKFFDDRLIVEVDGVANSSGGKAQDMQSILENVSIEYILNQKRSLRVKAFNTYDTDEIIAGNVLKIGAAFLISKDFDTFTLRKPGEQAVTPSEERKPDRDQNDEQQNKD